MPFSFLASASSNSFIFLSGSDSCCCCCSWGTSPAFGWRCPTGASREGLPCARALVQPLVMTKIRADATTIGRMRSKPFLSLKQPVADWCSPATILACPPPKWRRENGAADRVIVRCIVTGVPRAGDEPGPRAELCRRESLLQAIPAAKEQLNGWAKSGASEHLKAVAKHWQNLCEQFSIEDTP